MPCFREAEIRNLAPQSQLKGLFFKSKASTLRQIWAQVLGTYRPRRGWAHETARWDGTTHEDRSTHYTASAFC